MIRKKVESSNKLKVIYDGEYSRRKEQLKSIFPNVDANWLSWADRLNTNLISMYQSQLNDPTQAYDNWMRLTFFKAHKLGLQKIIEKMKEGKSFYEIVMGKK